MSHEQALSWPYCSPLPGVPDLVSGPEYECEASGSAAEPVAASPGEQGRGCQVRWGGTGGSWGD